MLSILKLTQQISNSNMYARYASRSGRTKKFRRRYAHERRSKTQTNPDGVIHLLSIFQCTGNDDAEIYSPRAL